MEKTKEGGGESADGVVKIFQSQFDVFVDAAHRETQPFGDLAVGEVFVAAHAEDQLSLGRHFRDALHQQRVQLRIIVLFLGRGSAVRHVAVAELRQQRECVWP